MADGADGADGVGEVSIAGDEAVTSAADTARPHRWVIAGTAVLVLITGALGGWDIHIRRGEQMRESMVAAAQAGVLALTTIDHERVDADVQRILDTSTGALRDDFAERAESFKDAARKAGSKSAGTVAAAGLESSDGDSGQVLVALTVITSNRGAPERRLKNWRTRVSVIRDGGEFKISAVEFVS